MNAFSWHILVECEIIALIAQKVFLFICKDSYFSVKFLVFLQATIVDSS